VALCYAALFLDKERKETRKREREREREREGETRQGKKMREGER